MGELVPPYPTEQGFWAQKAVSEHISLLLPMTRTESGSSTPAEKCTPSGFIERADFVTVYRWNRLYPADVYFDADLAAEFKQVSARDFAGFSHDRITCELWKRKRRSADNNADNNTDKGETK